MKRTCFKCKHHVLCVVRHGLSKLINLSPNILNTGIPGTPSAVIELFETLANCCFLYEEREDENSGI